MKVEWLGVAWSGLEWITGVMSTSGMFYSDNSKVYTLYLG